MTWLLGWSTTVLNELQAILGSQGYSCAPCGGNTLRLTWPNITIRLISQQRQPFAVMLEVPPELEVLMLCYQYEFLYQSLLVEDLASSLCYGLRRIQTLVSHSNDLKTQVQELRPVLAELQELWRRGACGAVSTVFDLNYWHIQMPNSVSTPMRCCRITVSLGEADSDLVLRLVNRVLPPVDVISQPGMLQLLYSLHALPESAISPKVQTQHMVPLLHKLLND
jgi:hypothetical protein